jgi:hypothetical protein
MKTCPVGAQFFYADRQTDRRADMNKVIVAFLSSAHSPLNVSLFNTIRTKFLINGARLRFVRRFISQSLFIFVVRSICVNTYVIEII